MGLHDIFAPPEAGTVLQALAIMHPQHQPKSRTKAEIAIRTVQPAALAAIVASTAAMSAKNLLTAPMSELRQLSCLGMTTVHQTSSIAGGK